MSDFENYMKEQGMQSLARFEKQFIKLIHRCQTREDLVEAYISLKKLRQEFHNAQCAMWSFYNDVEESLDVVEAAKTISSNKDKVQTTFLACEKLLFNDKVFEVVSNYFN
jgi:hypothetical protein